MSLFESITIHAMHPDGWPMDFALKPGAQPGPAMEWLEEHGYAPAEMPASGGHDPGEEASFTAETITATVDDGKAYWKVKGGPFTKFGVTVWPEVLGPAGFDVDQLNPLKPVNINGWTAYYLMKPNGQPKKVVRLVRPGGEGNGGNPPPAAVVQPAAQPGGQVGSSTNGHQNGNGPTKKFHSAMARRIAYFKSANHVKSTMDLLGLEYPADADMAKAAEIILSHYAGLRADGVEQDLAVAHIKMGGPKGTGFR